MFLEQSEKMRVSPKSIITVMGNEETYCIIVCEK